MQHRTFSAYIIANLACCATAIVPCLVSSTDMGAADRTCDTLLAASVSPSFSAPAPLPVPAPAAEEAERPRKKPRKKQEYVPGVGTANYAFIIVLYQVAPPMHASLLCIACSTLLSKLAAAYERWHNGKALNPCAMTEPLQSALIFDPLCPGTQAWRAVSWEAGPLRPGGGQRTERQAYLW